MNYICARLYQYGNRFTTVHVPSIGLNRSTKHSSHFRCWHPWSRLPQRLVSKIWWGGGGGNTTTGDIVSKICLCVSNSTPLMCDVTTLRHDACWDVALPVSSASEIWMACSLGQRSDPRQQLDIPHFYFRTSVRKRNLYNSVHGWLCWVWAFGVGSLPPGSTQSWSNTATREKYLWIRFKETMQICCGCCQERLLFLVWIIGDVKQKRSFIAVCDALQRGGNETVVWRVEVTDRAPCDGSGWDVLRIQGPGSRVGATGISYQKTCMFGVEG